MQKASLQVLLEGAFSFFFSFSFFFFLHGTRQKRKTCLFTLRVDVEVLFQYIVMLKITKLINEYLHFL